MANSAGWSSQPQCRKIFEDEDDDEDENDFAFS
jgi:hypothetical protein